MSSNPLSPIGHPSPREQWELLGQIYSQVLESAELRPLLTEAMSYGALGKNPDLLLAKLDQAQPAVAMTQFRKINPQLDLANLMSVAASNPTEFTPEKGLRKLKFALGLIQMFDNS